MNYQKKASRMPYLGCCELQHLLASVREGQRLCLYLVHRWHFRAAVPGTCLAELR